MKVLGAISKYCMIICICFGSSSLAAQHLIKKLHKQKQLNTLPNIIGLYQPNIQDHKSAFILLENPMSNLGFVCKWEHENDKKSTIPLRFRLGTLDYVNKLEGK